MDNTPRVIIIVLLVAVVLAGLFAIIQGSAASSSQSALEDAQADATAALQQAATDAEVRSGDLITASTQAAREIDTLNDTLMMADEAATEAANEMMDVLEVANAQATSEAVMAATSTQVSEDIAVIGAAAGLSVDQRSEISAAATVVANDLRSLQAVATSEAVSAQSTQTALEGQIATLEAGGVIEEIDTAEVPEIDTAAGELERFTTENVELYLPANYLASDLGDNLDDFLAVIEGLGGDFAERADQIRANVDDFELYAFAEVLNPDLTIDSTSVTREEVVSSLMLEDYLALANRGVSDDTTVLSEELIEINGLPAARTFFETEFDGYTSAQIRYVLQDGDVFYTLTYTTSGELIEDRLPLFQASAATFRVLDTE